MDLILMLVLGAILIGVHRLFVVFELTKFIVIKMLCSLSPCLLVVSLPVLLLQSFT